MSVPNINGEVIGGQYNDYAPSFYKARAIPLDGRYPPNSCRPAEYVPINYEYEPTSLPPFVDKTVGRKDDGGKLRYDLIPPEALEELAKVLTFGAHKYDDRNWEKGMNWGRVFGAAMRHMWSWWRGYNLDAETGYSHLSHALTCIAFLITYEKRKVGVDDRFKA